MGAAECQSETGHHLVKYQYTAVLIGQVSQRCQETVRRRYQPHITGNRFYYDTCNLFALLVHYFSEALDVIIRKRKGMIYKGLRNTRASGNTQCGNARTCRHKQGIGMTMIASVKFNDGVPAGKAAGKSYGTHGCFCSGIYHANHFNGRNGIYNHLGKRYFKIRRCSKTGTSL